MGLYRSSLHLAQLVETYIEASGIAWTHLHPNMFMENMLTLFAPRADTITVYWGTERTGWVALDDLADVAAKVLTDGPAKHGGQDYWMSTEAANGPAIAAIIGKVTGRDIRAAIKRPEDFKQLFLSGSIEVESWYAEGAVEFVCQVYDGRMGYIGGVRDDVPYVLGRQAKSFPEWAEENREALVAAASSS
ncbi:NmrA family NAD(P)-binding protein [Cupriavidus sp. D39]|nr:NmrA family NAD(P)-binding protein [Cupriavidus sp. D39]